MSKYKYKSSGVDLTVKSCDDDIVCSKGWCMVKTKDWDLCKHVKVDILDIIEVYYSEDVCKKHSILNCRIIIHV